MVFVFKVGPFPVGPNRIASNYVACDDERVLEMIVEPTDAAGLRALTRRLRGKKLAVDVALREAALKFGLCVAPMSEEMKNLRAMIAVGVGTRLNPDEAGDVLLALIDA